MNYLGWNNNSPRGYWSWINLQTVVRPPRSLPNDKKDENYDATCARYYVGQQQATTNNIFRQCYADNVRYSLEGPGAWGEEEDIKTFLKDRGRSTSKVAFTNPLIGPILTRLRGAADNLAVSPMAEVATQFAKTRKEEDLVQKLAMSLAARTSPAVAAAFAPMGISPDEEQTSIMHENLYQDELVIAINSLMKMVSVKNGIDDLKKDVAKHIALSGLAAWHCSKNGTDLVWELCEPDEVGWDPAALRSDFADGSYVFTCPLMDVADIAERYQTKAWVFDELDKWSNVNPTGYNQPGWPQMKPRVFTTYWRDTMRVERGYVMIDGEPEYVTINEPDPDSRDGKPLYTDKDLVQPPENKYTAEWTDTEWANKKQSRYVQAIRYCVCIPWEYLPSAITQNRQWSERLSSNDSERINRVIGPTGDVILEHGVYPLQEANPDDTFSKGFPLKFATWSYIAGNVVAPITAAISPQRVMNQLTSDLMYRLRKAGHSSPAIDTDAMAGSTMSEEDIAYALKEGDYINLKGAMVGGLQNAVREIDTSPNNSFYNAFSLIPQIKQIAESATGVYEQNYGAPGSANQLVGTLQLQLQQAGVMQQPFYATISSLYKQVHQFNAQAGKQFYCRFPWKLKQMVGDIGYDTLKLSQDLQNEQFRIDVTLVPNASEMRNIVDNQMIPMRMQMGLLDAESAANLMGRAFPADVDAAQRRYIKRQAIVAQQQAEQAQQQQMAMAAAQEQQNIDQQESELAQMELQERMNQQKIMGKLAQPMVSAEAKWMEPQGQQSPMNPLNPLGQ
jgi:hypothetical protein